MDDLTNTSVRLSDVFVCPTCNGHLAEQQNELECKNCHKTFQVIDGMAKFARNSTDFGEFTKEKMRKILDLARLHGWRKVLEEHMPEGREFVADLILDDRRASFLKLVDLSGREIVLDLGCGYGGISMNLAEACQTVVSLDSSLERVSFLDIITKQEKIRNIIPVNHNDILKLPFRDNFFDLIVVVGVFEYFPVSLGEFSVVEAQLRVLAELRRVLKPAGCLYLATKNRYGWQYLKGAKDHNGLRFGPLLPRFLAGFLARRLFNTPYRIIVDSMPGYKRMFRKANFTNVRFHWPLPSYQFPEVFESLDADALRSSTQLRAKYKPGFKKIIIRSLLVTGILKYFVPNFSIVVYKNHKENE